MRQRWRWHPACRTWSTSGTDEHALHNRPPSRWMPRSSKDGTHRKGLTQPSHPSRAGATFFGGDDGTRTHDPLLAKQNRGRPERTARCRARRGDAASCRSVSAGQQGFNRPSCAGSFCQGRSVPRRSDPIARSSLATFAATSTSPLHHYLCLNSLEKLFEFSGRARLRLKRILASVARSCHGQCHLVMPRSVRCAHASPTTTGWRPVCRSQRG